MKKLVIITGAASGIGLETAKLFSSKGYPLLLLSLEESMPAGLDFPNSIYKQLDVTDYDSFKNHVNEAKKVYGDVGLIVNNAGVMLLGDVTKQSNKEWQKMMDINVVGVLNGMQIVLDDMIKNKSGSIINIASIAGIKTFWAQAGYCATKHGVRALSETVREEVSPHNVRVMVISPGAAETNLLSMTSDKSCVDSYLQWVDDVLDGVQFDPAKVAQSALYMYEMPEEITIRELVIASTKQTA